MRVLFVPILAILLAGIVSVAVPQTRTLMDSGNIWYVGDPPFQFQNITAAVNFENVTDGDIIEVMNKAGNYVENVTVDKSLTIRPWSSEPTEYPTLVGGFNVTSLGVTIEGFIIQNSKVSGINLASSGNIIINNTIQWNHYGIYIAATSANNTLQNNVMKNNNMNFVIEDGTLDHFIQRIDGSNTVAGKSICYLVNEHDVQVPSDPGYLVIVNSTGITADNFSQSSVEGVNVVYSSVIAIRNMRDVNYVHFYQTNDSVIENNSSPSSTAISLVDSCRNLVQNNTIINEYIDLSGSDDNSISDNTVNYGGIELLESNSNCFVGNNISHSVVFGIYLYYSNNSQIFHNNFLQNTENVGASYSFNTSFDNGYEGNYWDDYKTKVPNAVEIDGTGIWNTTYPINPAPPGDRFPVVEEWTTCRVINVTWYANVLGETYFVVISCPNLVRTSTNIVVVRNESLGYFTFNITAATQGYFNVTIPRNRLDYPFELYINGSLIQSSDYQLNYTRDASTLYFQYSTGRYFVKIVGYKLGNICGDLDNNGVVNMRDIAVAILNFNKHE